MDNKLIISQSAIKDWKKLSPMEWYESWILKTRKRISTKPMLEGTLLDMLCFTPLDYDKTFVDASIMLPSENIQKVVTDVHDHIKEFNTNAEELNKTAKVVIPYKPFLLEPYQSLIEARAVEYEFYAKKPFMAYNKVIKDGQEYFAYLQTIGDLKPVTPLQKTVALELKEILFTDKVSKGFFVPKKNCEVLFQKSLLADFEITGLKLVEFILMGGKLDIIHINHGRKEVREVDLKRTNNAFHFYIPVRDFDYPLQHSVYDFLLKEWVKKRYPGYTVMNPLNVVIDDVQKTPYIYEYSSNDLHIKRYGIEGTSIRGWEDVVREIAWHIDRQEWSRPKQHILNGKMLIEIFRK